MRKHRLIAICLLIFAIIHCAKDLRRGLVKDTATEENQALGRKILSAAVEAHGGFSAWKRKATTTVVIEDYWMSFLARTLGNPWPKSRIQAEMHFINGTMVSRTNFLGKEVPIKYWGVWEDSQTWETSSKDETKIGRDKDIRFIQRAIHYLNELPFRLFNDATKVTYVGQATIADQTYDRVFVTWGNDFNISLDYDQYVVYVDIQTGRISKVNYTVRDVMRFIEGCMHFDEYRKIEGIWFPLVQTVTQSCEDKDYRTDYLHQINVKKIEYNKVPAEYVSATR